MKLRSLYIEVIVKDFKSLYIVYNRDSLIKNNLRNKIILIIKIYIGFCFL